MRLNTFVSFSDKKYSLYSKHMILKKSYCIINTVKNAKLLTFLMTDERQRERERNVCLIDTMKRNDEGKTSHIIVFVFFVLFVSFASFLGFFPLTSDEGEDSIMSHWKIFSLEEIII